VYCVLCTVYCILYTVYCVYCILYTAGLFTLRCVYMRHMSHNVPERAERPNIIQKSRAGGRPRVRAERHSAEHAEPACTSRLPVWAELGVPGGPIADSFKLLRSIYLLVLHGFRRRQVGEGTVRVASLASLALVPEVGLYVPREVVEDLLGDVMLGFEAVVDEPL